jgi:hypothetical protein
VGEAHHEGLAVHLVLHDGPTLETAQDHVMERPRGVEPRLARHDQEKGTTKRKKKQRPVPRPVPQ